MTKEQIRNDMKQQRSSLSKLDRQVYDRVICEGLRNMIEYQECHEVFSFISFGTEVDTTCFLRHALSEGKQVYVPRVQGPAMEFFRINSLDGLIISRFGVPEPPTEDTIKYSIQNGWKKDHPRLMLLPGLAFDHHGNRIGYGAGYYDRYLSSYPSEYFYKLGLAYSFQILPVLPSGSHDIRADAILTQEDYLRCNN